MATIKSYTDINQSRKLAEILPIGSADNHYWSNGYNNYICGLGNSIELKEKFEEKGIKYLPCWSLAALLGVLPEGTKLLKSAIDNIYHCDCPKGNIDKWFDNPVDACVNMIIKLSELKML